MTDRQLYDKIYDLVDNGIEYYSQCKAANEVSEYIAIDIFNFLLKYRKTITYIDLGDDNDR